MNPRAAINDLHPFQGCPFSHLGYFSRMPYHVSRSHICKSCYVNLLKSGESGIRTHAPSRTNGFQDRLVMTASISLPFCANRQRTRYNTIIISLCQSGNFIFYSNFCPIFYPDFLLQKYNNQNIILPASGSAPHSNPARIFFLQ